MREILFRGKRKDNGEWVYGDLLQIPIKKRCFIMDQAPMAVNNAVIPATVGQYTGLTDKNGTKIFEGDIVKHYNHDDDRNKYDVGRIFWSDETYQFIRTSNEMLGCPHLGRDCKYKVIGNIYDNPELLKGNEKHE